MTNISLQRIPAVLEPIALAIVYVAAARIGFGMDAVAGLATLVWAPTGIALAALLLRGYWLWPGVLAGAFVANVIGGAPIPVAFAIGIGNTLEAVVGTSALRSIPGFRTALDRRRDAVGLIAIAAIGSTAISATLGVLSLRFGGVLPTSQMDEALLAWWLGDMIGALIVAPLILVWASDRGRPLPSRWTLVEILAMGVTLAVVGAIVFGDAIGPAAGLFVKAYLTIPVVIWSGLRFGQRGTVTGMFIVSVIAIAATFTGNGPFVQGSLRDGLFSLQTFMAVVGATFLVLGATVDEQRRTQEELQLAYEATSTANRAKSDFFAVMSHELRTPLNAISGYVDLLRLGIQGPITNEQEDSLKRIQRNQQHLLSLIDDVLSFASIEGDRVSVSLAPVRVAELLEEVEPVIGPDVRRKQLTFACEACHSDFTVLADVEKLRQVLLNLVANAVKFTPAGGRIMIGAQREDSRIRIWVSDTGVGIPAEHLPMVFEPFFQVERGKTRPFPGIGLGLSIARDLARAMNGEITLESTVGRGTTASLVLPVA